MYHCFNGHEMLDAVGLIHMNGRLYDPVMGRFVSADPTVQAPDNLQSFNRYSYVLNNPLFYTDPSGYWSFNFMGIKASGDNRVAIAVVAAVITGGMAANAYLASAGVTASAAATAGYASTAAMAAATTSGIMGMSVATVSGIVGGASAGFAGGLLASGGDINAGLRGALTGGVLGGVGASLNNSAFNTFERVMLKASASGAMAKLQGGSFGDGFKMEIGLASASIGFRHLVGWDATAALGENQRGASNCVDIGANCYRFDEQAKIPSDWQGKNVIGLNLPWDGKGDFLKQSGLLSKVLNVIPGMNAVAQFHDTLFRPGGMNFTTFNNVATMLPAAAVSYAAIIDQLPVDRTRCHKCGW
jgi:RHS repeat-associated protein